MVLADIPLTFIESFLQIEIIISSFLCLHKYWKF